MANEFTAKEPSNNGKKKFFSMNGLWETGQSHAKK